MFISCISGHTGSNQFVYDLAKSDLAYFYKDLLDDINKVRLNAWAIYYNFSDSEKHEKLLSLKTVIANNTEMFNLLSQGPTVMAVKSLNERINAIKLAQNQGQQRQGRTPIVWTIKTLRRLSIKHSQPRRRWDFSTYQQQQQQQQQQQPKPS
jgi:hypothetical protein